jgi:hypothetical protein
MVKRLITAILGASECCFCLVGNRSTKGSPRWMMFPHVFFQKCFLTEEDSLVAATLHVALDCGMEPSHMYSQVPLRTKLRFTRLVRASELFRRGDFGILFRIVPLLGRLDLRRRVAVYYVAIKFSEIPGVLKSAPAIWAAETEPCRVFNTRRRICPCRNTIFPRLRSSDMLNSYNVYLGKSLDVLDACPLQHLQHRSVEHHDRIRVMHRLHI